MDNWSCTYGSHTKPIVEQAKKIRGIYPPIAKVSVATLTRPSVGVKPNTWKELGFGILRDSRMLRTRQQGAKDLALRCSWCHWKGLEP